MGVQFYILTQTPESADARVIYKLILCVQRAHTHSCEDWINPGLLILPSTTQELLLVLYW